MEDEVDLEEMAGTGRGGAGIPEGAQREQVLGGRKRGLYLERESAWLVGEGRTWE